MESLCLLTVSSNTAGQHNMPNALHLTNDFGAACLLCNLPVSLCVCDKHANLSEHNIVSHTAASQQCGCAFKSISQLFDLVQHLAMFSHCCQLVSNKQFHLYLRGPHFCSTYGMAKSCVIQSFNETG